jgi:thiosulfate dehydrogenase
MKKTDVLSFILLTSTIMALNQVVMGSDMLDFTPIEYTQEQLTEDMHISRGGQLYDNWWKATVDTRKPEGDHPLWKTQTSNKRNGYSTYRCKECHGWDYRGKDGAYSRGSHYTGFGGVYATSQKMTVKEIIEVLNGSTNKDHDFSGYLSESDISDLSLFLKKGTIDLTELINAEGLPSGGDIAAGRSFYAVNCMTECHGKDGMAINFKSEETPEFLGTIANKNPWEFIHKVRAGQPGTRMSAGMIDKWSTNDLLNLLAYTKTLPQEKPQAGWVERMKITLGLGQEHKSMIAEEKRGFGPKLQQ